MRRVPYLFDLPGEHAALYTQHSGDVNVLSAHVIHPLGEALHSRLEEHPGELYDVEHPLDDVICERAHDAEVVAVYYSKPQLNFLGPRWP